MELPKQYEGLSGGELAAAIPGQQRIDMISKGYNILSESDVRRYYEGQASEKSIHVSAGVGSVNTFGESHMDYKKDYAAIRREMGDDIPFDDSEAENFQETEALPTKKSLASKMENYKSSTSGLDVKVRSMLDSSKQSKPQQTTQTTQTTQISKGPLTIPKKIEEKQMITEAAKAKQMGYNSGVKYLNAFISLLKQPSSANREGLLVQLNNMVLTEEKIHSSLLSTYRQGIAEAEKQLYSKIASKK